MKTLDFDYPLPDNLIAQAPLAQRDASRLLLINTLNKTLRDENFGQLPSLLLSHFSEPPLVVINESKVIKARVRFKRASGGRGEVFILGNSGDVNIPCLLRPLKKLKVGEIVYADITGVNIPLFCITNVVTPQVSTCDLSLQEILDNYGEMPLPPYIIRDPKRTNAELTKIDNERYQTVYSQTLGSVAASTAGLHFSDSIISACSANGIDFARIILHVGLGTFLPVQAEHPKDHLMHSETYSISNETCEKITKALAKRRPIVFVGTTALRATESFFRLIYASELNINNSTHESISSQVYADAANNLLQHKCDKFANHWQSTNLFVYPNNASYVFRPLLGNGLITNFHQPQSTLSMLVASILGYDFWKQAYAHAIENKYRFLSYGDSSIIIF